MRKTNLRLLVLGLILVGLLLLFILKHQFLRNFSQKLPLTYPDLKKETISELVITNDKTIYIYKKNNAWFLKNEGFEFRADLERIEKIINSIAALKKEDVVSNNKTKHKNFGIDRQKITLKTKTKNYTVYIGNSVDYNQNYLRVDNQNEVFVGENFSDIFYPNDYRDLNIYFINDENKVNYLQISYNNRNLILENKKDKWYLFSKELKREKVDFFINDLKTLKASDIFTQVKDLPEDESMTIVIKENNLTKTANFYLKDEENYYLKISYSQLIFQLPATTVTALKKEEKDFLE